jgi:septum site-determining protein MinC
MKLRDRLSGVPKENISLQGTRYGVIVSIAEEPEFPKIFENLSQKLVEQKDFFKGGPISLNLGWRELTEEQLDSLLDLIKSHNIQLQGIISSSFTTRTIAEGRNLKVIIGRLGLADHHSRTVRKERTLVKPAAPAAPALPIPPIGDYVVLVRKTIRSGQKFTFPGSVVIYGDINPGAEIEAEGDIFIIGTLRGLAHAGYKGKSDAFIVILNLQSLQLRIDEYLWGGELSKKWAGFPVIAKVENNKIVVYPFSERRD